MGESEQSGLGTDIPKTYNIVSDTLFSVKYIDNKENMSEEEVIILTVTKDTR